MAYFYLCRHLKHFTLWQHSFCAFLESSTYCLLILDLEHSFLFMRLQKIGNCLVTLIWNRSKKVRRLHAWGPLHIVRKGKCLALGPTPWYALAILSLHNLIYWVQFWLTPSCYMDLSLKIKFSWKMFPFYTIISPVSSQWETLQWFQLQLPP